MESKDFHPIQDIRKDALELSGLTYERAFAIDEFNISNQVNEYFTARLMEKFYTKIYADPDDSFRYYLNFNTKYCLKCILEECLLPQ